MVDHRSSLWHLASDKIFLNLHQICKICKIHLDEWRCEILCLIWKHIDDQSLCLDNLKEHFKQTTAASSTRPLYHRQVLGDAPWCTTWFPIRRLLRVAIWIPSAVSLYTISFLFSEEAQHAIHQTSFDISAWGLSIIPDRGQGNKEQTERTTERY
jgi:hypothetical protein